MNHRVVITGMGLWSCLGTTLDEVRDALYTGKSGIIYNPERNHLFDDAIAKLKEQGYYEND